MTVVSAVVLVLTVVIDIIDDPICVLLCHPHRIGGQAVVSQGSIRERELVPMLRRERIRGDRPD